VTEENQDTMVSPHFTLKQFACNQDSGFPKYLVLRERLVLKLEDILEKVNKHAYRCDTFHIMSGYRTPYYNELNGNVKHSMHLWGGAADIFIDESPKDGMMDDLNKDGRIDWRDAPTNSGDTTFILTLRILFPYFIRYCLSGRS